MRDYYDAADIQRIIGVSKTLAYEIIRKLRKSFEKKYPEAISIQARIPKWYFEEIMKNKKVVKNNEEN